MFLNYITKKIGNAMSIVLLLTAGLIALVAILISFIARGIMLAAFALHSE